MLYTIASTYFNENDLSFVSPEDEAFQSPAGPEIAPSLYFQSLQQGANLFIGFRGVPLYTAEAMAKPATRVIVFVRNPLDVLVSRYFQFYKFSAGGHAPSGSASHNEAMIKLDKDHAHLSPEETILYDSAIVIEQFREFSRLALGLGSRCRVFNYESFVFNKAHMFSCMLDFLGLPVVDQSVVRAAKASDCKIEISANNVGSHVRHIVPGDHLNHLSSSVIADLSDRFREIVRPLGYLL